jgi:hypothetical protein
LPSEPIAFETEHLDWYRPSEITELQANMRFDFKSQINELFRRVNPCAVVFREALEFLQTRELTLFRAATDADRNQMPLAQMHPKDQIMGFWAVITQRTNSRSLRSLCRAVDLFNHVVAGILSGTEGEAWAVIKTAEDFAPAVVSTAEELLYQRVVKGDRGSILAEDGARIQDLREDVECLRHVIRRSGWSSSTDHLERFLSLADMIRDNLARHNDEKHLGPAK